MRQRQQAYQAGYNRDSPSDPLQVGQKLWLRTSLFSKASAKVCSSLGLGWEGPYTILRVIKNGIYVLNKGKGITAHISRIKPVRREAQPRDSQAESPADSLDSNQANTHEPKITATGRGIPEGHPLPRRASPGQVHSGAREGGHPCPGRLQPGEGEAPPRPAVPGPHSARSSGDPPATQRLEGQEGEREVGSRESTNSCEEDPGEEVAPSIPQILRHRGTDPYCRLTPQHQEEKGPCDSLPHGTF
ncbi:unnamed protein product [Trichogramma brassicae]|uniref:Uncharacterized protein n=1 Tax=Trichogramma brassicae TaxID=86971 RepID=A0A6H5IHG3_9HYME|nr:unnamed protein product [Trichogramma brassicae]